MKKIYILLKIAFRTIFKIFNKDSHITEFPLGKSLIGRDLPFLGNSNEEGFFTRLYNEPIKNWEWLNNFYLKDILHSFKTEILWGKITNNLNIKSEYDCVIPLSTINNNKKNILKVEIDDSKYNISIPPDRFYYLGLSQYQKLNINSNSNFIVGNILRKNQKDKDKKLVLIVFVDGLIDLENYNLGEMSKIMKNTYSFFKNGIIFKNHYSNETWSLPSAANFFSGKHSQGHGFFHSDKKKILGKNYPVLSEIFQKNDYFSYQINGSWRMNPSYGFCKGFDRTIYKRAMSCNEVVNEFYDTNKSFSERNQFSWLTFFDTHNPNLISDINSQISLSPGMLTTDQQSKKKIKSVMFKYNKDQINNYIQTLKRIDFYLGDLFNYISRTYDSKDYIISLVSDHGQSFVDDEEYLLKKARTHIPWMITGGDIKSGEEKELTENIDVFETIINKCNLKTNNEKSDGSVPICLGGNKKKDYVFTQNIFPNKTYKAVIRDNLNEFRFETINKVEDNGKFIINPYHYKLLNQSTNKEIINKNLEEKFLKICLDKVENWNKKII